MANLGARFAKLLPYTAKSRPEPSIEERGAEIARMVFGNFSLQCWRYPLHTFLQSASTFSFVLMCYWIPLQLSAGIVCLAGFGCAGALFVGFAFSSHNKAIPGGTESRKTLDLLLPDRSRYVEEFGPKSFAWCSLKREEQHAGQGQSVSSCRPKTRRGDLGFPPVTRMVCSQLLLEREEK